MYCAMAFDRNENVEPLCSSNEDNSLFVWDKLEERVEKDVDWKNKQLDAIAYLWELCYNLALAKSDNVSQSPGFESFGLKINSKGVML